MELFHMVWVAGFAIAGARQEASRVGIKKWRAPLRNRRLDYLRDENIRHFEATTLFNDPWQARNDSIELILNQHIRANSFLYDHAGHWLSADEQWRALAYLEQQRWLLLMYTSCGWFFNDISGIETLQILKYAGRAIDLMKHLGLPSARDQFLEILAEARSNRSEMEQAQTFIGNSSSRRLARPPAANLLRKRHDARFQYLSISRE